MGGRVIRLRISLAQWKEGGRYVTGRSLAEMLTRPTNGQGHTLPAVEALSHLSGDSIRTGGARCIAFARSITGLM